ncbi:MAG: carboxypeptidase-like regulatory domain-containing protein [Candidatus Bathyarchaeia archaeon]
MKRSWLTPLLLIIITSYFEASAAAPQLVLTVSLDVQYGTREGEATITFTGRVMDPYNKTVQGAAVSSQLTDPNKSSLHVSLVYSKGDGSYQNRLNITNAIPGNYTLHLKASKPGYDDAALQVPLLLVSTAFNLKISPVSRTLKQGSNGSFEIAIIPFQRDTLPQISVKILGLPPRVTYNLLNRSTVTPRILTLTLITRPDTPAGTYNFTVVGEARGYTHSTWGILEVAEAPQQSSEPPPTAPLVGGDHIDALILPVTLVLVGGATSILILGRFRLLRASRRVLERLKPSEDREYLAIARAIARLEELRASEKIDQETYSRLRQEYEERLDRKRRKS